jgi:hypothetical protein
MLTEQQAFEAMRYFLAEFWKRGGSKKGDDLSFVLGWTERTHCEGGSTNDPGRPRERPGVLVLGLSSARNKPGASGLHRRKDHHDQRSL